MNNSILHEAIGRVGKNVEFIVNLFQQVIVHKKLTASKERSVKVFLSAYNDFFVHLNSDGSVKTTIDNMGS